MQAFEWTKLIIEKAFVPGSNPMGRVAVRLLLLHDHGIPRPARLGGRDLPPVVAMRVLRGFYDRKGTYETVEITGLYWHFVDLVWVFIFAFFYLW